MTLKTRKTRILNSSAPIALGLALVVVACASVPGGDQPAKQAPTSRPARRAVDETRTERVTVRGPAAVTTAAGARLQVPAGFVARRVGSVIHLDEPDGEAKATLVELRGADCVKAVTSAWAAVEPGFAQKQDRQLRPPASKGFDEICVVTYASRADGRQAWAVARRKGQRIWVSLVRGSAASLDKRQAQIRSFLTSMKAPGVVDVDLSGKKPASIADGKKRAALVSFINEAIEATRTPGLAIAVVEEGKVVLAEGFGVRELWARRTRPVTADTLMMIGSVTKSLTTLMMARLVDEGRLKWDGRVVAADPTFRLADPKLTAALTVEQLVCACAGLPRKDLPLILEFARKRPRDVYAELSRMTPSTKLRETFQYQNHMVAAGGYVAGHAFAPKLQRGRAYDQAMAEKVLKPLGMSASTFDHRRASRARNRATPHAIDLEGKHHIVELSHERFATYIRPSGGLWSNARDMAKHLLNELGRGAVADGRRIVSAENLTHRWKPQVKINANAWYGLGWVGAKKKGLLQIQHGGGTMGFATLMVFLPDKGRGAVMISNGTGGHAAEQAIWSRLFELWFDVDDKAASGLAYGVKAQKDALAKLRARLREPEPAVIDPLVGVHHNDEIGKVVIRVVKAKGKRPATVWLDAGEYKTQLKQHDRPDGNKALLFLDPPLAGFEIEPKGGSFEMKRAQERYIFSR